MDGAEQAQQGEAELFRLHTCCGSTHLGERSKSREDSHDFYRGHSLVQQPRSEAAILLRSWVNQAAGALFGGCMADAFPHGTVHEAREDLSGAGQAAFIVPTKHQVDGNRQS